MTPNTTKGFTLIELMIVIAIIGILGATALPMYGQYTKRAKYTDVIARVVPYKTAVGLCIQDKNSITPCDSGTEGIGEPITTAVGHLESLSISNGSITATGTLEVSSAVYKLDPQFNSTLNILTWTRDDTVTNNCNSKRLCK